MNRTARTLLTIAALSAALGGGTLAVDDGPAAPPPAPPAAITPSVTPGIVQALQPTRAVGRPTGLLIPRIGVAEALVGVGLLPDGAMATPAFGTAGWYEPGPRPGAPGPAVLVAHVHGPAGDDVFARLGELVPGDRIAVKRTDGAAVFVVERVEQTAKTALPVDEIWNEVDEPVLRLITCAGTPDPVTRMYPDNTVVYARLA